MSMSEPIVICDSLVKIYKVADLEVVALQGLDLEVGSGEMMAIVGASGSGKSTLLNILSAQDTLSAGRCFVDGNDLTHLSESQRIQYRRFIIGHIWQQSGRNLLPELSVAENVELPQLLGGIDRRSRKRHTRELLELVGLESMSRKKPAQLSGGEQQRVAIAVAIANEPKLLLADEPTGELDSVTAGGIFTLLHTLSRQLGLTVIAVTHDAVIAAATDRTIAIRDGRTSTETVRREAPSTAASSYKSLASAVVGLSHETHRESVLIDRVGRLQLPKEALETFFLNGRAEVRIASDHVELWPFNPEKNGDPLNGNGTTQEEVS
jgi:ABC-type lipoprotein export system ATPase subunit